MGITFATYLTGKTARSLPLLYRYVKRSLVLFFLAQNLQPRRTSEYYITIIVVKTSGDNGVLFILYSYTYFSFAVLVTFFFCIYLVVLVSFFSFSFFSFCVINQFFLFLFLFGEGEGSIVSKFVIFVFFVLCNA